MNKVKSLLVLALVGGMVCPPHVHAYNFNTHSRIVECAADAMQRLTDTVSPLPRPATPSGVDPAAFDAYLDAVEAAPGLLKHLRTGLPNKTPSPGITPIPGVTFGTDAYPFQITYRAVPGTTDLVTLVPNCEYFPEDNLSNLNAFRIEDFRYFPNETAGPCGIVQQDLEESSVLGTVLGWHSGSIDNHIDDAVMWFKPTNSGLLSPLKDLAFEGSSFVVGSILLPFYCIVEFLSNGTCDSSEIYKIVDEYNPIQYVDGWLPGIGDARSSMFTGVWHFENVFENGDFNNVQGLYYPEAGPDLDGPGCFDIATMAAADLSGMSLNAYASDGDDFYGDYDDVNRHGPAPWQTYSMGHTEFSSLGNLAKYGWEKFLSDGGSNAAGLGWPLHAIGDAAEPHHVIGSSSWGHRPYEDVIENYPEEFFPRADPVARDQQLTNALVEGFSYWTRLQGGSSIRNYIRDLATDTSDQVAVDGNFAYSDEASLAWMTGTGALAELAYLSQSDKMKTLLEMSAGATIAFLATAASQVTDLGPGDITCPAGTFYHLSDGCVTGGAPTCFLSQDVCATTADCPDTVNYTCEENCCLVVPQ